ncbi:hypothetical protein [Nocardioides marmoribigeumensis]|uniref:Uncharacterized protein n=1 Tax=Nocardioides marmoribigeumensis TaxID=433649 RepID=A0ABU2BV27_9ACTN|nr:hypothetical protein [Nocardioides marmoribigeumensis]MDR7362478.1 hypothetical protein [Nocardioides marmoribigeumensis]
MTDPLERAAWSWVAHLLAGGTTAWAAWVESPESVAHDVRRPVGLDALPGAAQLELLRVLVEAAGAPLEESLALRVLRRPAPGRGPVDLPLGWPGEGQVTADGFHHRSAPPTDPGSLDVEEVLRVAAGVIADLLLEEPAAPRRRTRAVPTRLPRPRTGPSVWVEGPPRSRAAVRAELAAGGTRLHRPRLRWRGGRTLPDRVLVVVPPLERGLLEVWEDRSVAGAARRWERWVQEIQGSNRLPPSLRSRSVALWWAERIGADRVQVTVRHGVDAAGDLSALEVDVLRRVNAVLVLHRGGDDRAAIAARLGERLQGLGRSIGVPGPAELRVPVAQLRWLQAWSARITDGLTRAGYPVDGDLASLRPRPPAEGDVHSLDPREVLALMTALLLPGRAARRDPR